MPHTPEIPPTPARRIGGRVLTAVSLVIIGWSTLKPESAAAGLSGVGCCSPLDLVLNAALFVPLGAGLVLLGVGVIPTALMGALLSTGVELSQLWWIAGRISSASDVGANAAGAIVGALVVVHWGRRARWWPVAAPVLATVTVLAWLIGALLVRPVISGPAPWVVVLSADSGEAAGRRTELLGARLQDVPLPQGPVAEAKTLLSRLSSTDTSRFTATIVTGSASSAEQRLIRLVRGKSGAPFLKLSQEGARLVAYRRLELNGAGLDSPTFWIEDALPSRAGDTVLVSMVMTPKRLQLSAVHGAIERKSHLTLSADLYLSALFYRATGNELRWRLLPAFLSIFVLGLALATRPRLLALSVLLSLFGGAWLFQCGIAERPVVLVAIAGAFSGRRLAQTLILFPRKRTLD